MTLSNRELDSRPNFSIYCYSIIDNRELVSRFTLFRSFLNEKFLENTLFYVFFNCFSDFGEMTAITQGTLKIR